MNFLGIDVAKEKLDCSLLRSNLPNQVLHKTVANTPDGMTALLTWAMKKAHCKVNELYAILEATGSYHEIAADSLFNAQCSLSVINPAYVKNYARSLGIKTKTDRVDANILARYGREREADLIPWLPPPPQYAHLDALIRRKQAIETDLQRELNRLEKQETGRGNDKTIASIKRMIAHLKQELEQLDMDIEQHIQSHSNLEHNRGLLQSIIGIGEVMSTVLLPVFQTKRFKNAPQVAAYLGVIPIATESGSSVKKPSRLSKTGQASIRAKLYFAAITASRHNPDVKALYERLLNKGKSKMCAIGAAMRKLIHICFGVLKHQTPFCPQTA